VHLNRARDEIGGDFGSRTLHRDDTEQMPGFRVLRIDLQDVAINRLGARELTSPVASLGLQQLRATRVIFVFRRVVVSHGSRPLGRSGRMHQHYFGFMTASPHCGCAAVGRMTAMCASEYRSGPSALPTLDRWA